MIFLIFLLITVSPISFQIQNVPFIRQKTHFCGPAALSSVMSYYEVKIKQDKIAKAVYTEKLKGALITDLENYAKKANFKTILAAGFTNDLKKNIRNKKPVLALIDVGFWIISLPHYVVIFGYNNKGFITHTGYASHKLIKYNQFQQQWKKMGNVYLVVYK